MKQLILLIIVIIIAFLIAPEHHSERSYNVVWHSCNNGKPTCGIWMVEEEK